MQCNVSGFSGKLTHVNMPEEYRKVKPQLATSTRNRAFHESRVSTEATVGRPDLSVRSARLRLGCRRVTDLQCRPNAAPTQNDSTYNSTAVQLMTTMSTFQNSCFYVYQSVTIDLNNNDIYIYTHVCIYIYIHKYICVYIYIYICTYVYTYILYAYIYIYMKADHERTARAGRLSGRPARFLSCALCVYCIHICMYVYVCICIYIYIYIYTTYVCIYIYIYTYTYTYICYLDVSMIIHVYIYIYMYMYR